MSDYILPEFGKNPTYGSAVQPTAEARLNKLYLADQPFKLYTSSTPPNVSRQLSCLKN